MRPNEVFVFFLKPRLFYLQLFERSVLVDTQIFIVVFKPFDFVVHLALKTRVRFEHFLDLGLILLFNSLCQGILVKFMSILSRIASFLKLLQGDFEFLCRLVEIFLVGLLLIYKELAASLPKCFFLVIVGLSI